MATLAVLGAVVLAVGLAAASVRLGLGWLLGRIALPTRRRAA
jgi:hypothetical protein